MKLQDLKNDIQQYQHFEDTGCIDVALAGIIATKLRLGDPIWLIIIGPSSGGKSQILRPLAMIDSKFLHRVDDLTENTFLSGMKVGKGKPEPSLLHRIGALGMIVVSDLTVIFSKNKESRSAILSQFRMIYDGEMVKFSGTSGEPLMWKGELGVLAGSTPSIYSHFEEVADMGERFIYYRMKDYDGEKATRLAMGRAVFGKELDKNLADKYTEYVKGVVREHTGGAVVLPEGVRERIVRIAGFAERIRTPISMDFQRKDITRKPVVAFPMRVALQLVALAKGLAVMRAAEGEELGGEDMKKLDWCAYSLANEEKRGVLKILAGIEFEASLTTQKIADLLGLSTNITGYILQNLSAVGVLIRSGNTRGELIWRIIRHDDWQLVREIEGIDESVTHENRELSTEESEKDEMDEITNKAFDNFGK